jgi:hypothetical protein
VIGERFILFFTLKMFMLSSIRKYLSEANLSPPPQRAGLGAVEDWRFKDEGDYGSGEEDLKGLER